MTGQARWTAAVTGRLLIEAGYSTNIESFDRSYQPGSAARSVGRLQPHGGSCFRTPCDPFFDLGLPPGDLLQTDPWYALATREDLALDTRWNAARYENSQYPQRFNVQAALSYVTGSHSFKVGFADTFGSVRSSRTANADLEQEYISGRPAFVTVYNTPFVLQNSLNYDLGVFAQDRLTLDRLTLDLGVRFDWAKTECKRRCSRIPASACPNGFFSLPERPTARPTATPRTPAWRRACGELRSTRDLHRV